MLVDGNNVERQIKAQRYTDVDIEAYLQARIFSEDGEDIIGGYQDGCSTYCSTILKQ